MIYLDTSAAVPIFVSEPASDALDEWFDVNEVPLVSCDWILAEFASALSLKVRRGELAGRQATKAWGEFELFSQSGLRLLPVTRGGFARAAKYARDALSGLRSGDSLHLAMALEIEATELLTIDDTLARNAIANGLATVQIGKSR